MVYIVRTSILSGSHSKTRASGFRVTLITQVTTTSFHSSQPNKYAMLCLVSFTSLYAAYYAICCHCFTLEYALCSSMQWVHSLISSVPSCWMLRAGGEDRQGGGGEDRGQSRGEDRGEGAQSQRSRLDNFILSVLACTL